MPEPTLPSVDLVVATVDRVEQLSRLFDSLERQSHQAFRVLLVDQNPDERLGRLIEHRQGLEIAHLRSERGLSRARNLALRELSADIVAFPDDDCVYPDELLERVARHFAARPELGGLSGRAVDPRGRSSPSWERDPAILTRDNLWNRVISFAVFLRRSVVVEVGEFDERLGLGASPPWSSGEEVDYLIRAVDAGARVEYDPELTVVHDDRPLDPARLRTVGYRDGASVGYLLRKHRYQPAVLASMFLRPLAGSVLSLARRDVARARFHGATARGRLLGYRRARRLPG